jgi:hypothetical protein
MQGWESLPWGYCYQYVGAWGVRQPGSKVGVQLQCMEVVDPVFGVDGGVMSALVFCAEEVRVGEGTRATLEEDWDFCISVEQ